TFRMLDLVCAQDPEDIDRWAALGIVRDRIRAVGSIKYDPDGHEQSSEAQGNTELSSLSKVDRGRPVLFGGSTHRGEEEVLANVFLRLRQEFPSLRLFIAPRHVERLREIRAQFATFPMHVTLASELASDRESDADFIILDTTGELQHWYPIATIVFIGKSLTAHGGQNPVEPIMAGKPVVFGPHMENFGALARALVTKKGAMQVRDIESLERTIAELLRDSHVRQRLVQNAREVLSTHQGATARAAALIHDLNQGL